MDTVQKHIYVIYEFFLQYTVLFILQPQPTHR
jgi:hypothetical protein